MEETSAPNQPVEEVPQVSGIIEHNHFCYRKLNRSIHRPNQSSKINLKSQKLQCSKRVSSHSSLSLKHSCKKSWQTLTISTALIVKRTRQHTQSSGLECLYAKTVPTSIRRHLVATSIVTSKTCTTNIGMTTS